MSGVIPRTPSIGEIQLTRSGRRGRNSGQRGNGRVGSGGRGQGREGKGLKGQMEGGKEKEGTAKGNKEERIRDYRGTDDRAVSLFLQAVPTLRSTPRSLLNSSEFPIVRFSIQFFDLARYKYVYI
jgi:hypothetical protein